MDAASSLEPFGSGDGWTLSPVSDASFDETIRGTFSSTPYINFLNGGVEAIPVFGSPLDAPYGSRTLGKDILIPDHEQATPLGVCL